MAKPLIEILAPVFNFAGAAVLTFDALRARQNVREKSGAKDLINFLRSIHKGNLLVDEQGKPLDSPTAIDDWLAGRTLRYGWIGFVLIAIGFLLEFISKIL